MAYLMSGDGYFLITYHKIKLKNNIILFLIPNPVRASHHTPLVKNIGISSLFQKYMLTCCTGQWHTFYLISDACVSNTQTHQ